MQLQQISTYIDLLIRWNARINLTGIRDPDEIVTRHFGESLFLARHLFGCVERAPSPAWPYASSQTQKMEEEMLGPSYPETARASLVGEGARPTQAITTVLDIGSGAGFPGLPLKIWAPGISLTMIESNHKKAAFLREAVRALTLTDVNVTTARAETLLDTHDIVTLRAVERFDTILPTAASLLAPAGRLALLIGSSQLSNLETLTPDLRWSPPIPVPQSHSRMLSISIPL